MSLLRLFASHAPTLLILTRLLEFVGAIIRIERIEFQKYILKIYTFL